MFCKHGWEVLIENQTESQMEQAKRLNYPVIEGCVSMFNKKVITILTCKKCGKLKKFVENI